MLSMSCVRVCVLYYVENSAVIALTNLMKCHNIFRYFDHCKAVSHKINQDFMA